MYVKQTTAVMMICTYIARGSFLLILVYPSALCVPLGLFFLAFLQIFCVILLAFIPTILSDHFSLCLLLYSFAYSSHSSSTLICVACTYDSCTLNASHPYAHHDLNEFLPY